MAVANMAVKEKAEPRDRDQCRQYQERRLPTQLHPRQTALSIECRPRHQQTGGTQRHHRCYSKVAPAHQDKPGPDRKHDQARNPRFTHPLAKAQRQDQQRCPRQR